MTQLTKEQAEELAAFICKTISGSYNLSRFYEAVEKGDLRYAIEHRGFDALEYGHAREIEDWLLNSLTPDIEGIVVEITYEESLNRTIKEIQRRLVEWSPVFSSNPIASLSSQMYQQALQKAHLKWLPSIHARLLVILNRKENSND